MEQVKNREQRKTFCSRWKSKKKSLEMEGLGLFQEKQAGQWGAAMV